MSKEGGRGVFGLFYFKIPTKTVQLMSADTTTLEDVAGVCIWGARRKNNKWEERTTRGVNAAAKLWLCAARISGSEFRLFRYATPFVSLTNLLLRYSVLAGTLIS